MRFEPTAIGVWGQRSIINIVIMSIENCIFHQIIIHKIWLMNIIYNLIKKYYSHWYLLKSKCLKILKVYFFFHQEAIYDVVTLTIEFVFLHMPVVACCFVFCSFSFINLFFGTGIAIKVEWYFGINLIKLCIAALKALYRSSKSFKCAIKAVHMQ